MKVLHIITGLGTGGAERALYELLAGDLSGSHEVHVVSLGDVGTNGPRIRALGVPVTCLNIGAGSGLLSAAMQLRRLIRDFRPDIIQGWMYHGNLAATVGAWLSGHRVPVVWNVRQTLYDLSHEKRGTRLVIRANRLLSAQPGTIIYNSVLSRRQHQNFGFRSDKATVIPNGFDLERWKPDLAARKAIRAELGLSLDVALVGHVARYHPMKDHRTYLEAIQQVANEFPDTHFVICGRDVSPENPSLAPEFASLPSGRIHVLGERHDVERLMPALDILCSSSAWGEGFPNVLGEAMACGVPCVSTDVGDSKVVIGDEGIVVPASDSAALAWGVATLLAKSEGERVALAAAARERIQANFGLPSVVGRYHAAYNELVKGNQA